MQEADVANGHPVAAFLTGLTEQGYVAGQNIKLEYRWADGHFEQLGALAGDLVRRGVNVIAVGAPP